MPPPFDVAAAGQAAWICSALAGRPAQHANAPLVDGNERRFGLVLNERYDGRPRDIDEMMATLASCGIVPEPVITFGKDAHHASISVVNPDQATRNAVLQLRQAGVTTVIVETGAYGLGALMVAADQQGWAPEWLYPATMPSPFLMKDLPLPNQYDSVFGPYWGNPDYRLAEDPAARAISEVDPALAWSDVYGVTRATYRSLLLLSSGIQAAGPDLTPDSFAAALQSTQWWNGGAGAAPLHQARVGIVAGQPWWNRDASLVWWDTSENDAQSANLCHALDGRRWSISWPTSTDDLYQPPRGCAR